jgi:tRNA (guanine-N7-)-methyltransferase
LHWGDALNVLQRIPDGTLTMIYLLHPDPWPKNKHAKRRMMNDGPVKLFADKLKPGGEFRFGTDHPVYLRHALMVMQRHSDRFEWQVRGRESWENRPSGWCETRYEHKARTVYEHEVWYFRYRRK